jgi:predicted nucleic acid-binding protein
MTQVVLLDSGPLGLATNPKASLENAACNLWIEALLQNGKRVIVPAIADYEIRRELLRAGKSAGLKRLDNFCALLEFRPLEPAELVHAAQLWATLRQTGKATSHDHALDGDVILAAQALSLGLPDSEFIVATTNVAHLSLMVPADLWKNIPP